MTAWLASDRPRDNATKDPAVLFTSTLLDGMGDSQRKHNLAACLRSLQQNPELQLGGFQTMGGVPPRLTLWSSLFGRPDAPARPEMVLQVGHADKITSIASSADGRLVFTASQDSLVRVWSMEQRTLLRNLTGHEVGVSALGLSGNGQWLVSGGGRGASAILAYDLKQDFARKPVPIQPHIKGVVQVVMLPDGVHFVSVSRDAQLSLGPERFVPDSSALAGQCRMPGGGRRRRRRARRGRGAVRRWNSPALSRLGNRGDHY